MTFKTSNTALYQQNIALRDKILRRPFGKSIGDDNLELEKENLFFAALEKGELVPHWTSLKKRRKLRSFVHLR